MNFSLEINKVIFKAIYGLAHRSSFFDALGIFFADYVPYILIGILLVLVFYPKTGRAQNRAMVLTALFSAVFARFVIKPLILLLYSGARPFILLEDVKPLVKTMTTENLQSFPSGHALFFFALAAGVYFYNRKLGLVFLVAATLMGLARIYTGVHWPVDVIAGAFIGFVIGFLSAVLYKASHPGLSANRGNK